MGVATTWLADSHADASSVAVVPPAEHAWRTCSARLKDRLTAASRWMTTVSRWEVTTRAASRSLVRPSTVTVPAPKMSTRAAIIAVRSLTHGR
jgi:hypothetical protein